MRVLAAGLTVAVVFGLAACTSGSDGRPIETPATTAPPLAMAEQCQSRGRFDFERPDLIGMPLADVRHAEVSLGRTIRVLGEDGSCYPGTDDLKNGRVDVYVQSGIVESASMEVGIRPECPKRFSLNQARRSTPATAQQMVPDGAMFADLCRYSGLESGRRSGRLLTSAHPDAAVSAELARLLNTNGIPNPRSTSQAPIVIHCGMDDGTAAKVLFTYPRGKPVVIDVELSGCTGMTNGRTSLMAGPAITQWLTQHTPARQHERS